MTALSIMAFFVINFGLGYAITRLVKESDNFLERNLMRVGIGLGTFITIGLLFNLLRVPLDYRIFLGISIASILLCFFKNREILGFKKTTEFKLTQTDFLILLMLILFGFTFFMYHKGAFAYPYLENDDSWGHALGVKYVSIEKTVFTDKIGLRYLDPYPPAYDMVFGILHQTNNSVYWTLKFFNALIISLSIVFFYFFAKIFANSSKKALFSTFALFATPAFLSHFIWSIAITMPLFFVSFYSVAKIKQDKRWWLVSSIVVAATLVTSPTHSTYFGLFLVIYLVIRILVERKSQLYEIVAGSSGLALSLILWWIPVVLKHGLRNTLSGIGVNVNTTTSIFDVAGTADRIYSIKDFFIAQKVNMINNPIGIGLVLSLLLIISFVVIIFRYYNELKNNKLIIFIIFLITLVIVLLILSQLYVKYVTKKNLTPAKPGTVTFSEFSSEQTLLILTISITLFLLVSLVVISYKNQDFKDEHLAIIIAFFIFSFFAVNAGPFYYKLSPFRAWLLLAIPVALLAGEAINSINSLIKSFAMNFFKSGKVAMLVSFIILGLIAYGVIMTSFVQKYAVNTAIWGPGGFWTFNEKGQSEELGGYIWLKDNLPSGAKVFTFSNNAVIIGLDKFTCHWCSEVNDYKFYGFNQTAEENYNWLKKEQYKYIVIDGQAVRKFGTNETNRKIQTFINFNKFKPILSNNGMILFEVV